jgi:hypothetical protein
MRSISLLLLGAMLASCTTAVADQQQRTPRKQARFDQIIAGKVAGAPLNCLPSYLNANDMTVIDDSTIVFSRGASSGPVYVAHMRGPCTGLGGAGANALVTRQVGASGLCSGDIATVQDLMAHITVGSCTFGEFIPYTRPGA